MTSTDEWIDNVYPGADMREDLFDGLGVTVAEAADATGLSATAIDGFLNGTHRVDANFDLRMGRFFGLSMGYFLRLQNSCDLMEAKRRDGAVIEAIQPRFERAA
jgi:addiction module HigA family antidote